MSSHFHVSGTFPRSLVRRLPLAVVLLSGVLFSGCVHRWVLPEYPSITVKVVDAETGAPVDNAVAVCVWWSGRGVPGLSYTKTVKVTEGLTDARGKIRIPGYRSADPRNEPPILTVYKRGYAAWNSREIFPDRRKRTDFEWKNGETLRMEKWKEGWSYDAHGGFIYLWTEGGTGEESIFRKALEWERVFSIKEVDQENEKRRLDKTRGK